MTTQERLIEIEKKTIENNWMLLDLMARLKPDEQKFYAERVSMLIERTIQTVSGLNKKVPLQAAQ